MNAAVALARADFRHAVTLAAKAVERRATIPILSMVRCRANGAFEASGTDLDITITASVSREDGPDALFMLPDPGAITGAVNAAGGESVAITPTDKGLTLASGELTLSVDYCVSADDFPTGTDVAEEVFSATLSHSQLRSLQRIASSVSTEETRYYLNGICLHLINGGYRAVATDGHRLSLIDLALPDAKGELPQIIIPRKAIRVLLALAGSRPRSDDSGIVIRVGSGVRANRETSTAPDRFDAPRARLEMQSGKARVAVSTKLIDGTFPDYRRVIPDGSARQFLFKSDQLRRAIAATSFGSKKVRAVRLQFDDEGAKVSAKYIDTGIATEVRIDCQHDNKLAEVGFNGGYLMSMIDACGGDEFLMITQDAASPALIKNPADTEWTGVLMPMRV